MTPVGAQVGLKAMGPESEIQFLASAANPTISADGRWLAYESNRSGSSEIWVQPLAFEGGPWQVSQNGGGGEPVREGRRRSGAFLPKAVRWRDDERAVQWRNDFDVESIEELFPDNRYRPRGQGLSLRSYDVSRDRNRFLMVQEADPRDSPLRIGVYQDWLEEVTRLESAR